MAHGREGCLHPTASARPPAGPPAVSTLVPLFRPPARARSEQAFCLFLRRVGSRGQHTAAWPSDRRSWRPRATSQRATLRDADARPRDRPRRAGGMASDARMDAHRRRIGGWACWAAGQRPLQPQVDLALVERERPVDVQLHDRRRPVRHLRQRRNSRAWRACVRATDAADRQRSGAALQLQRTACRHGTMRHRSPHIMRHAQIHACAAGA